MTPLVLIPGMMCDARLYQPQIDTLSSNWHIHLAAITEYDSIPQLATDILAHTPPRFALAGLSMGGIVAMEIYAQAAHRVERLALMDTNPLAEIPQVAENRNRQIARVRRGELKAIMRDELKPLYLAEGPRKKQILDICLEMALSLGTDIFVRQSRALQKRNDQQHTLQTISVPTLILHGENDTLCPVDRHRLMQHLIHNSQLIAIPGAGHLPTLEQPARTTTALLHWLTDKEKA